MGELVELIFGLAMLGFILFMIIGIPMTIINGGIKAIIMDILYPIIAIEPIA